MQSTNRSRKGTIGLAAGLAMLLAVSLPAAHAQSMKGMGTMDISGQAGASDSTAPGNAGFLALWKEAAAKTGLNPQQWRRLAGELQGASGRLAENWTALQDLRSREAAAADESKASIRKRIDLAEAERDLIISEAETDMRDYLTEDQVMLIMMAAFHGASRSHSEEQHPMTMGMAMTQEMTGLGEYGMKLAEAVLKMNEGFKAVSLEEILKELAAR